MRTLIWIPRVERPENEHWHRRVRLTGPLPVRPRRRRRGRHGGPIPPRTSRTGSASCRERVYIPVVAASLKNNPTDALSLCLFGTGRRTAPTPRRPLGLRPPNSG